MKTLINFIFIVLFGAVLALPMVLTITDTELTEPLEENRVRAPFPELASCDIKLFDGCHKQVDGWFNDNYQPRDLLIKLKTQVDYSVFSISDKVHIGLDNWLFYRSVMDVEKVAVERITQEKFDGLLAEFDALDRYLKNKGIQLIVLPIPLKNAIYPELVPRSSPNLPEDGRYHELREWLAGHESILTIDAYQHMLERKEDARVFHKTDFHWNDPGGFLYAEKLVNMLWHYQSGEPTALWEQTLTIEERPFSGGQANFLPLLSAPEEQGLFLDVTWDHPKGIHDHNPAEELWDYTYNGKGDRRAHLGTTVVIGDSFFDAMRRSGIDAYFSTVFKANNDARKFGEVYENIPEGTQFLILEFIEVSMFGLSVFGLSVPEAE